jgi:phosphate transport system permease protein
MANRRQTTEKSMQAMFFIIATASISILFLIMLFLFKEGLPIFKTVSVKDFIFGQYWYPTSDPADFGIFPLIVASLLVTGVSGVFSIPLGVMTAIYLSEIARPRVGEIVKPMVEMLAALPSVVIGFFGMVLVAPFLQRIFDIPTGLNLFNASLMLAFMSIPTICSISEDAIHRAGGGAGIHLGDQHGGDSGIVAGRRGNHGCAHGRRRRRHAAAIHIRSGEAHAGQHRGRDG